MVTRKLSTPTDEMMMMMMTTNQTEVYVMVCVGVHNERGSLMSAYHILEKSRARMEEEDDDDNDAPVSFT
jgi:hypothetical protein